MKLVLLASLFTSIARAGDVDEHLTKEEAADSKTSDDAACWCKKFRKTLEDQDRERRDEVGFLESIQEREHYSNQRLQMEVSDHHEELATHESSLRSSESLANRGSDKHEAEEASQKSSLKDIRKAIDVLPKNSPSRAALRGMEKKLQDNLDEASANQDRRHDQMQDLRAAKSDMLRLERQAMERKTQRYANGLVVASQAKQQLSAYSALADTDADLARKVDNLCERLSSGASERHRLRLQATIASADTNFKRADRAASNMRYKLVSLTAAEASVQQVEKGHVTTLAQKHEDKHSEVQGSPCSEAEMDHAEDNERRAVASLDAANAAAGNLNQLLSSSSGVQSSLKALFHTIAVDEYLISSKSGVSESVKAAIEKIAAEAKDEDSESPALFDEVRSAGRASMLKHARLVTSLRSIKADLSMDRIKCQR